MAKRSICQYISISGQRCIKWAALLISRWDFEPIGKSIPHHYIVCVCMNYSWHQGKFYLGLVCGKSRGFSTRRNWAQILVLWLIQMVTWGRWIMFLGFSHQWHGYGTCFMGLPWAVRQYMRNSLAHGVLPVPVCCLLLPSMCGLMSFLICKMGIHWTSLEVTSASVGVRAHGSESLTMGLSLLLVGWH